jgi:hypothetical protein
MELPSCPRVERDLLSTTRNLLATLAAVVFIVGCGGSGPEGTEPDVTQENAVRFLLADLQAASRDGDGDRICNEIFTPALADSVTSASKTGSCAREVEQELFTPQTRIVVQDVEIESPTEATATVTEQNGNTSEVSLVEQSGEWRVNGVEPA